MTPEELAGTLARLDERTAQHGDALTRIETKVTLTNGRVTGLEAWKNRAMGAWFVVSLAGPLVTGIVLKFA